MGRTFNTDGCCERELNYMVDLSGRLAEIKTMVDGEKYFTINRARQYGKTTLLNALADELKEEYEEDYHTGMEIGEISRLIFDYTSGYPFLVSRLCKLMDEKLVGTVDFKDRESAWTKEGVLEAVKRLVNEKNTLFESLIGRLNAYQELKEMIYLLLFQGQVILYNADDMATDMLLMFGFVKVEGGTVEIANRVFETRLYNYFLTQPEPRSRELRKMAVLDKNLFVQNGQLNMERILEKFVVHFDDIYQESGTDRPYHRLSRCTIYN